MQDFPIRFNDLRAFAPRPPAFLNSPLDACFGLQPAELQGAVEQTGPCSDHTKVAGAIVFDVSVMWTRAH
jgi:hypothetical protein